MIRIAVFCSLAFIQSSFGAIEHSDVLDPEIVARLVGNRLVAKTEFELKPRAMNPIQQGYLLVHLPPVAESSGYLVHSLLNFVDPSAETTLRLSHSAGRVAVYADGELVLISSLDEDGHIRKLDYGVALGETQTPTPIPNETSGVLLHFVSKEPGPAWLALGVAGANRQNGTAAHRFASPVGAGHPAIFRVLNDAQMPANPLGSLPDGWQVPAVPLVLDIAEPLAYSDWRYFTGAALTALADVSSHFESLDFSAYIDSHVQFFLSNLDRVATEREQYHLIASAFGHYFRFQLLDDVGPQSAALAVWAANAPAGESKERVEDIMRRAASQIMNGVRLEDGTFARITPFDKSVWADDLFMGGLSLVHLSRYLGDATLLDEAARQALLFDKHLKDGATGLYWHGWFDNSKTPSSSKWGRANGWTMMAKAEILMALPQDHPQKDAVMRIYHDHAQALLTVQSKDGRWHQVLDLPRTYLETSATAMFVRAFAEGVTQGWLPRDPFAAAAERGWAALVNQIGEDGKVEGIVRGTPIFFTDNAYEAHKPRTDDPRGLGAILYATVAMDRMRQALTNPQ